MSKRSLIQQAGWMLSSGLVQAAISFVAMLVLIRFLDPVDFGKYAILLANVALIPIFINLRINDLVLRADEAKFDSSQMRRYASALVVQTVLTLISVLALLYMLGELTWLSLALLLGILGSIWAGFFTSHYEKRFEYKKIALLESTSHVCGHVFSIIGVLVGMGASVLYLRDLIRLVILFIGLSVVGAMSGIRFCALKLEDITKVIKEMRGIWLDGVLENLYGRLVILCVGFFAGERAAGFLFQGQRLAMVPHQLLKPLAFRMSFNYFSRHKNEPNLVNKLLKISIALGAVLVFGVIFIDVFLLDSLPLVFGDQWNGIEDYLMGFYGLIVAATLFDHFKSYQMAVHKMKFFILVGRSCQFGALFLALIVATYWGYDVGVSLAYGISFGLISAVLIFFAQKLLGFNKRSAK